MYVESSYNVTRCQESAKSKAVCGQNELFGDDQKYSCINVNPSFFHLGLYAMPQEPVVKLSKLDGVAMRVLDRKSKLCYVAYRPA